jgi:pyruvate ferredoxin oxidoreductase delta subunit
MKTIKEVYIEWCILPEPGSAKAYKTGSWRVDRYPHFKYWKCQACPPGREECPDATANCTVSCSRACLLCWLTCPDDSIILENGVPAHIDMNYCKGCGICEKVCPRDAFEMKEIK